MIKDLGNNLGSFSALDATVVGAADSDGTVINTQGFEGGVMVAVCSAYTTGDSTMRVQEGDLANGSDMADIPAERITTSVATIGAVNEHSKIGFIANKQYVRQVQLGANTPVLTVVGLCELGYPNQGAITAHVVTG
jgi:hypothetical protein